MPIHFLHIGKTGGSAVKNAIEPYSESRGIIFHPHPVRLRDIPAGEPFVFFLRHPVQRFISGFLSRQRQGRPLYNSPWSEAERVAFTAFEEPGQLGDALSSFWPPRRAKAREAMTSIEHVRNSFYDWIDSDEYFHERRRDMLFVGFQERLDDDFRALKAALDLPESLLLPTDDLKAHRNPAGLDRSLSRTAVRNLKRWYAKDIALYDRVFRETLRHSGQGALQKPAGRGHRAS